MNTPNPLLPQGSLQSQSKGKSNFRIAVFTILAIHVVLICGFLIQGCKPGTPKPEADTPPEQTTVETTNDIPPFTPTDTNNVFPTDPNAQATYEPPTNGGVVGQPTNFGSTGAVGTAGITGAAPNVATSFTSAPAVPGGNIPTAQPSFPGDNAVATGEMTIHSVARGEMLSTIARKYRVTVRAIEEANPGLNPLRLQIGQKLNIPAAAATSVSTTTNPAVPSAAETGETGYTTYTVKSGDVLERIARNNNTTVRAIKEANGMKLDRINVGQKLKIPKKN